MPSLSPTMEEGTISEWNKEEGEAFLAGDVLCQVETDKATVDFEAQDDGVLVKILVDAGPEMIACGAPICVTTEEEVDAGAFADFSPPGAAAAGAAAAVPAEAPEPAATPEPVAAPEPAVAPAPPTAPSGGRVVASPLARVLAAEAGTDISAVPGTGPGGRVIAADVREYVPPVAVAAAAEAAEAGAPAVPLPPPVFGDGHTDYPLTADATVLAARLAASKSAVPHYYLTVDVRLDSLLALRKRLNGVVPADEQLTLNDFLIKAAASAMRSAPAANASWMDTFVRLYDDVHINVAIGQGDGLVAPLIRNANSAGLKSISDSVRSHQSGLEDGTLSPEECAAGTFTIVNLGQYGIKSAAAIVREPQACVLAIGAAEERVVPRDPTEDNDSIYEHATYLTATLSCDHRVIDGAVGAQWLAAFKGLAEGPESLLL